MLFDHPLYPCVCHCIVPDKLKIKEKGGNPSPPGIYSLLGHQVRVCTGKGTGGQREGWAKCVGAQHEATSVCSKAQDVVTLDSGREG